MAFLIVEKGPAEDVGKSFALEKESVVIGRRDAGVDPDITLSDPYVSRRHAEIVFDQGRYTLHDLGSTNGTLVDGARADMNTAYRLVDGTIIGLGISKGAPRVSLRFRDVTTAVASSRIEAPGEARVGWLSINRERQEVLIDGKPAEMSRKEYDLLSYLEANAGRLCRKDDLIANVWPEAANPDGVSDAAIDQLIRRLRTKVEPHPATPTRIVSRRGFGYMLLNS